MYSSKGELDRQLSEHLELARRIAYHYVRKYPYLKDDIVATAESELVFCLDRAPNHPNFPAYLATCISGKIKNLVMELPALHYKRSKKNKKLILETGYPLQTPIETIDRYTEQIHDDILESRFFANYEREIMKSKMEGYTDAEIGQMMGKSAARICQILKECRKTFDYIRELEGR